MKTFETMQINEFITVDEQQQMKSIAVNYLKQGILEANPRGPGRYRARIWNTELCTDLISSIGERIIEQFHLEDCPVDHQLGWIISLLQPGAQIQPHIDKYPYHDQLNAKHLRCNIMISRDNISGNPVINGNVIDVAERALWGFFPSEQVHCTQVIETIEPRIVYQFGFVVPSSYKLKEQYRRTL